MLAVFRKISRTLAASARAASICTDDAEILDITYAVGIAADKVAALSAIQARTGAVITLICDSPEVVIDVAAAADKASATFPVMIEIDTAAVAAASHPRIPSCWRSPPCWIAPARSSLPAS